MGGVGWVVVRARVEGKGKGVRGGSMLQDDKTSGGNPRLTTESNQNKPD